MFSISALPVFHGEIGLCPLPGRFSPFAEDLEYIVNWSPSLVVSLVEEHEFGPVGSRRLQTALTSQRIDWRAYPIKDFATPEADDVTSGNETWRPLIQQSLGLLKSGERVLFHCYGGCGRSGMFMLRAMCDAGEQAEHALSRLRAIRACAVETDAQLAWATGWYWHC